MVTAREEEVPLFEENAPKKGVFHPSGRVYRYFVLLWIALICFGSYFTYDEIENLEKPINKLLGINHAKFGLLYSVYSFPNMILTLFGGILGDKIGLRLAGIIYVSFVVIGAFLTALGPQLVQGLGSISVSMGTGYIIMVAGRVIFGIGSESLNVTQTSMVALWFKGGRELAMAMGLTLSMSRLGDFLALAFASNLADLFGNFLWVLWIGGFLCTLSFISTIIYGVLDKIAEKHVDRVIDPSQNELNFKAILHFDVRFWIVSFLCMTYYSGVLPFVSVSSDFISDKWGYSSSKAGHITSIVTLSSMILSPVLGKLLDILGRKTYFIILGSVIILPAHLCLAFTRIPPIYPLIAIGLSFSIVPSALWPSVPLVIPDKETATAFGVMTAIQNAGLGLMNWVAGQIADAYGYTTVMMFFAGMDGLGLLMGIALLIVDKAKGGQLAQVASNPEPKEIN